MKRSLFLAFLLLGAWSFFGLAASFAESTDQVRPPILAGTWYPGDPATLQSTVAHYLSSAAPQGLPEKAALRALIAPHAGYRYSGATAAYAYQLLKAHPAETVVVMAPSHRVPFQGFSVYDRGSYQTPLGRIPLDLAMIDALKDRLSDLRCVQAAHRVEHSIEVQLPFLQTVVPGFRLVPVLVGKVDFDDCVRMARALASIRKERSFVVIASTDLSHYHSDADARVLDRRLIDRVRNMDSQGLWEDLSQSRCEACGGAALVTALLYAGRFPKARASILHYATSADTTGDRSRVVGYLAAALWTPPSSPTSADPSSSAAEMPPLSAADKEQLKAIARRAIEAKLQENVPPPIELAQLSENLRRKRGAFVTLKIQGRLRGCIGQIVGRSPLAQTVARMAVAAAFQDPRFPPLTREEWPGVTVEISALTPLRRVHRAEEIQVGRHGLYLRKGWKSGLLLPQVATEYGWDRDTFLEQTCRKAGLPADAWRDPETEIYIFSAEVF
ncbi:hypothetical protein SAMN02746041_02443 [Desulfacinum hydrothermale DSM 13146]|uniref:MEMO1 family protein SAMN02746041_02443 n=1 Tax=Desulfacinum hydrothermale DSM 13146 TaxID=1121390 RepID=A0A1W1XPP9_9BACT|nr:AmmeMemoRadiSam system protein B [Desulfacinum hydrothermale]SMC25832.1 hypothetical protein SAMN02746041_02443 [Desulfacinum hydrothermale DSM 13146]